MFIEIQEKSSILVIDPNPALHSQLLNLYNGSTPSSATSNASHVIDCCNCCLEAKRRIQQGLDNDARYQIAFVETQLADGNGLKLINELWQLDHTLQIVLCTADPELTWQQIIDIVGESDQLLILQKPFSELELRQIVQALVRKWQLIKQSQDVLQFMEHQIALRTQDIEAANKNLLQSEKLAAVGQLAAGIAHEINTPAQYVGDNINAISDFFSSMSKMLGFYRQLLSENSDSELKRHIQEQEKKEDLDYILEDAPLAIKQSLEGMAQIVRIVQAMKGFSHIGQSRTGNIDVNLALENTLLVTRSNYKYIADVETHFADLPSIECYPGELNQVFLNIIVNAAHAIEDSQKGRGKITVSTNVIEGGIEVRISDTGTGIPESIRDKIFDPFFTTKDVGRGSGQGLNIAYRIIHEQHQGTLNVESELGVGTTFIIRLNRHLPASSEQ